MSSKTAAAAAYRFVGRGRHGCVERGGACDESTSKHSVTKYVKDVGEFTNEALRSAFVRCLDPKGKFTAKFLGRCILDEDAGEPEGCKTRFALQYQIAGDTWGNYAFREMLLAKGVSVKNAHGVVMALWGAVEHFHSRGVLHGDIHADNVCVARDSVTNALLVRLIDFSHSGFAASPEDVAEELRRVAFIIDEAIDACLQVNRAKASEEDAKSPLLVPTRARLEKSVSAQDARLVDEMHRTMVAALAAAHEVTAPGKFGKFVKAAEATASAITAPFVQEALKVLKFVFKFGGDIHPSLAAFSCLNGVLSRHALWDAFTAAERECCDEPEQQVRLGEDMVATLEAILAGSAPARAVPPVDSRFVTKTFDSPQDFAEEALGAILMRCVDPTGLYHTLLTGWSDDTRLALQYCSSGTTWLSHCRKGGFVSQVPLEEARLFADALVAAVRHFHKHGVVHGSIAEENIIWDWESPAACFLRLTTFRFSELADDPNKFADDLLNLAAVLDSNLAKFKRTTGVRRADQAAVLEAMKAQAVRVRSLAGGDAAAFGLDAARQKASKILIPFLVDALALLKKVRRAAGDEAAAGAFKAALVAVEDVLRPIYRRGTAPRNAWRAVADQLLSAKSTASMTVTGDAMIKAMEDIVREVTPEQFGGDTRR